VPPRADAALAGTDSGEPTIVHQAGRWSFFSAASSLGRAVTKPIKLTVGHPPPLRLRYTFPPLPQGSYYVLAAKILKVHTILVKGRASLDDVLRSVERERPL